MAQFENHIFPNVPTPYTRFMINHLTELAALVDAGRLKMEELPYVKQMMSRLPKGVQLDMRKPPKELTTLQVLKLLFKGGHFKPMKRAATIKPSVDLELNESIMTNCQRLFEVRPQQSDEPTSDVEEEDGKIAVDEEDQASKHGFGDQESGAPKITTYYAADFEAYTHKFHHEACLGAAMRIHTMRHFQNEDAMDLCVRAADQKERNSLPTEDEQPPIELTEDRAAETDPSRVHVFDGKDVVDSLFFFIIEDIKAQERAQGFKFARRVVFFHNLKYDRALFEAHPKVQLVSVCESDGNVYQVTIRFQMTLLYIRDSAKLVPNTPLSAFRSTFQLDPSLAKKEFINYEFYRPENSSDEYTCSTVEYLHGKVFDSDKEKNLQKYNAYLEAMNGYLISENMGTAEAGGQVCFKPWGFYKFYLKYDVLVLAAGIQTMQREMFKITSNELNVLESLTLASFSHKYMSHEGAYDGVYEMSTTLREYQMRAVAGGRTCVNPQYEGQAQTGQFEYLDAVSLYPSAIAEQCEFQGGFPTGEAYLLKPEELNMDFLAGVSDYTVTIQITAIRKKQHSIPFIRVRTASNGLDYVNELIDDQPIVDTVDKVTLEDYQEFHGLDFEILEGIYWTGSKNQKFGQIMAKLHAERKGCKTRGETTKANLIKLIMNSAYGKSIQKSHPTRKFYVPINKWDPKSGEHKETNWRLWIFNKFNVMDKLRFIGDHVIELTEFAPDSGFTLPHIGSRILATSKRLMNRVFNLCSELKAPIYYTDTDSFLVDRVDVPRVAAAFESKYNRVLLGENFGQFHSDFTFKKDGKSVDASFVHSTQFWPMGKKLYCHRLRADLPDGSVLHSIQYKCKGCTEHGLVYKAREFGEGDEGVMALYQALADGKEIEVPLNPPGFKPRFEYDKNNRVSTHGKIFYRTIRSPAAIQRMEADIPML